MGKMFKYINYTSVNQQIKDTESLSKLREDNILLMYKLHMDAEVENRGFLHSVAPLDVIENLNRFFGAVKSIKVN